MNKITILILIAAISGIGIAIVINRNGNGSGCCMEPPCKECFEKLGYCRCEEWEKNGGKACDECEEKSPDCGKNDSEVCELKHNQKV